QGGGGHRVRLLDFRDDRPDGGRRRVDLSGRFTASAIRRGGAPGGRATATAAVLNGRFVAFRRGGRQLARDHVTTGPLETCGSSLARFAPSGAGISSPSSRAPAATVAGR